MMTQAESQETSLRRPATTEGVVSVSEDDRLSFDAIVPAYRREILRLATYGYTAGSIEELLVAALSEMGYAQPARSADFKRQIEALLLETRCETPA